MEWQCQPCGSYKAHKVPFCSGKPRWHGNRCRLYEPCWTGWSTAIAKGQVLREELLVTLVHQNFLFPIALPLINYRSLRRTWMWFGWTETSLSNLIYEAHMINFPAALSDRSFKSNETFLRFHWQLLKLRRHGKRSGESRLMWKLDRDISEP